MSENIFEKIKQGNNSDILQGLLDNIKQHFELITTGIEYQDNYTVDVAKANIEETEQLLKLLHSTLREMNLSGFPADIVEVSSIVTKQKQVIDIMKQSYVQSTANANAIMKAFVQFQGNSWDTNFQSIL